MGDFRHILVGGPLVLGRSTFEGEGERLSWLDESPRKGVVDSSLTFKGGSMSSRSLGRRGS